MSIKTANDYVKGFNDEKIDPILRLVAHIYAVSSANNRHPDQQRIIKNARFFLTDVHGLSSEKFVDGFIESLFDTEKETETFDSVSQSTKSL